MSRLCRKLSNLKFIRKIKKGIKMKKVIGLFVAILACSAAQSESYFAASVTKFDTETLATSFDLTAVTATYGTVLGDNMSGELRFGLGVGDDSYSSTANIDGYDLSDEGKVELDHYFGAYLKFSSTPGEMSPYAILGLTKAKASANGRVTDDYYGNSERYSLSDSKNDFSYGIGIDFANGFNIEYMQYLDKGGLELNGLSLGMKF
jgi:opacity protein-like surface antigen